MILSDLSRLIRPITSASLVPSFSLLFAIPILHELPTRLQALGVVLVTAGMVLVLGLYDRATWRRAARAAT